ncbi:MAG: hypothetical protein AABW79_02555 [Nanoarchaeota archaeon]
MKLIGSFILLLFCLNLVFAYTSFTGVSSSYDSVVRPDIHSYYSGADIESYWPVLNNPEQCLGRQDILIQVSPAGCQPAVVRSDLLAEQNVPVFCQLDALTLNPLLDVKSIDTITFTGDYPEGIIGTGFHPARAALRSYDRLLGDPIINNIGYLVVVLKKQSDESKLPGELNATLQARIRYKADNVLGVGRTEFLLKEQNDQQWSEEKNKNSFWKGRFFVRLESADANSATLSFYQGDKRISSVKADKGANSGEFYLPGSYCQMGLSVAYDGFVPAERSARVQVDDEVFEVTKGMKILGNCRINDILNNSQEDKLRISCSGKNYELILNRMSYLEGDVVEYKGSNWTITKIDSESNGKIKYYLNKTISGVIGNEQESTNEELKTVSSDRVFDKELEGGVKKNYEQSMLYYMEVAESYPNEKDNSLGQSYGEQALSSALELSIRVGKEKTASEIAQRLLNEYPNTDSKRAYEFALDSIYSGDSAKSRVVVNVNGESKVISLIDFKEPSNSEKSRAYFNWGASSDRIEIVSKGIYNDSGVGQIVVESLSVDNVRVSFRCEEGAISGNERKTGTESFKLGDSGKSVCGRTLVLDDIILGEQVKIRILPKAKNLEVLTNVSVIVGIEKRALKLTPDKAKERIEELNNTIKKWEGISNNLGNTVKGLKTACFATAGVLTVKNFLTGLSGEGIARQKVMRDYWNVKCAELVNAGDYSSVGECYYHKTNEINSDVAAVQRAIEAENVKIKSIESDFDESVEGIGGVFGEKNVDTEEAASKFAEQEIVGIYSDEIVNGQRVGDLIDEENGYRNGEYTYGQLTEMKLNLDIAKDNSGASDGMKQAARERLEVIGKAIKDQKELISDYSVAKSEENGGVPLSTGVLGGKGDNRGDNYVVVVDREAVSDGNINKVVPGEGSVTHVAKVFVKNSLVVNPNGEEKNLEAGQYVLLLKKEGNNYVTKEVYKKNDDGSYTNIAEKQDLFLDQYNLGSVKPIDEISYNNVYLNPKLRYYETEPFKGMPAIVPFNKQQGWYAATKQTLPGFGGIGAFDSSGRVAVLWVCNVGANGIEQFFEGVGDDTCVQVNLNTGQSLDQFPGMSEEQARRIILQARDAVQEASQKYKKGLRVVQVRGETFEVGSPAANIPSSQCQNYMSPEECRLLFNVCDPVICPSSRCDFGGAYPVPDVIQTGIVGSALLCLPNFNEGIYIPVCLTGIKAGIDGYLSILKSHQLCLQENIESGKYVGICDEISAVYACEFFWRQAAPLANVALPKLVELASGQIAPRGGGEYLTTQAAWQNTQESINYFTQTYAVNSLEAFRIRSVEEAGSTFCKAFISAKGPKTFEALIEPDSPAQFHAWFSSTPYTSATVPATSQYKVFYHIYSGNDIGVNYVVYLKDPPETSYYQSTQTITVASGFAPKGQFATETKDFTAPEGYKQLCVRINNKEECGFKQVSTSFAVNQLRDGFAQDELTRADIKTEASCISGGALSGSGNVGALIQPNVQAGAEEFAFGQTYDRGIVRICATDNPGSDTDPTRFVNVGYCGDVKIRCWLDSKSADNAITDNNIGVRNATIVELEKIQEDSFADKGIIDRRDIVVDNILKLQARTENLEGLEKSDGSLIVDIDSQLDRTFFNHQKARLILLKAKVYDILVKKLLANKSPVSTTDESALFEGDEVIEEQETPEVLTISDFHFRGNILFFKESADGLYTRGSGSSIRFYYDINGNSVNVAKLTNGFIELVPLSSDNSALISADVKEHLEFLKGKRYSNIEKLPAGDGIQAESSS